jgi:hypothetical protein
VASISSPRPPLFGLPDNRDQAVVLLDDPLRLDPKLIDARNSAGQPSEPRGQPAERFSDRAFA